MSDATRLSLLAAAGSDPESAAWQELASFYGRWMHSWLTRQQVQDSDAEDIAQEALTVLFRELPGFRHNGRTGAFRAFLRGVVNNRLREHRRRRDRAPKPCGGPDYDAISAELEDPNSRLTAQWNVEHDKAVCLALISSVEGSFREQTVTAFRRVALDQASVKDVADELGMSQTAVRIARSRVLKRLVEVSQGLLDDSE